MLLFVQMGCLGFCFVCHYEVYETCFDKTYLKCCPTGRQMNKHHVVHFLHCHTIGMSPKHIKKKRHSKPNMGGIGNTVVVSNVPLIVSALSDHTCHWLL